jgi:membrane protease YdiL (CAAX protease family)
LSDAAIVGVLLEALMVVGVLLEVTFLQRLHLFSYLTDYQRSEFWMLALLAMQFAAVVFVVIHIVNIRALGDPLSSIDWNANSKVKVWTFVGFAFAGVMTLALGLGIGTIGRFTDGFAPASIALYFLTTVLAQPFIEECYFRGILFVALANKIGEYGSAISTAVLFTLLHFSHHRFFIFPVALVLGLVRVRTKSVAACFLLHGGYNVGILVFQLLYWR